MKQALTAEELQNLNTSKGLLNLLRPRKLNIKRSLEYAAYEKELKRLQIELIKMQNWVYTYNERLVIIFEGRDAAGKGGAIRRFVEHLNPRKYTVVALPRPTEYEKGQWYFQRYAQQLPRPGQMVFFDRSWYNRAVVEPVNGFCSEEEYRVYMEQVPEFEKMLHDDGIRLIKFWFSIGKTEQKRRFDNIKANPLKVWKISPVDDRAQELWDDYTEYKNRMFDKTHTEHSPWMIIKANNKRKARLESIKYVLNTIPYGKDEATPAANSKIVKAYKPKKEKA